MGNGPSRSANVPHSFFEAGETMGDPFEISTTRREDFVFHAGKSEYEDILQANNLPSTMTSRGHQGPSAFLTMASGLDAVRTPEFWIVIQFFILFNTICILFIAW